jgi:hypothetical protein
MIILSKVLNMAKRTILVTGASDWVIPAKDNGECFTPTLRT